MSAPHRSPKRLVSGVAIGLAVLAVLTVVGIVIVPQVRNSMVGTAAEGDSAVTVTTAGVTAEIPLTMGWSYRPALWDESRVTLRSPDGWMSIELHLTSDVDPADSARAVAGVTIDVFDTEPLGGMTLVHARVDDATLVGALTDGADVLTFVSTPSPAYDAELATLLSSIRFAS